MTPNSNNTKNTKGNKAQVAENIQNVADVTISYNYANIHSPFDVNSIHTAYE